MPRVGVSNNIANIRRTFLNQSIGPGAENLQLLLDYEDPYDAGLDLPNLAPNGPDSLTANNNPGVETASPIVGQQSGDYTAANSEYHSHPYNESFETNQDLYVACFCEFSSLGEYNALLSTLDTTNEEGFELRKIDNDNLNFGVYDTEGFQSISPTSVSSIGSVFFLEGWYLSSGPSINTRANDASVNTMSLASTARITNNELRVGARPSPSQLIPHDGLLEMVLIESAPQGDLFWPDHPTWLYNSGNGRSSDEILQYSP